MEFESGGPLTLGIYAIHPYVGNVVKRSQVITRLVEVPLLCASTIFLLSLLLSVLLSRNRWSRNFVA